MLTKPIAPGSLNLLLERHPADTSTIPYTVRDGATLPSVPPDYNGFFMGLTPYDPTVPGLNLWRGVSDHGYFTQPEDESKLRQLLMAG